MADETELDLDETAMRWARTTGLIIAVEVAIGVFYLVLMNSQEASHRSVGAGLMLPVVLGLALLAFTQWVLRRFTFRSSANTRRFVAVLLFVACPALFVGIAALGGHRFGT